MKLSLPGGPRPLALVLAAAALAPPAGAQLGVMLEEDFEAGLPADWVTFGFFNYWHVGASGECGTSTRMASFNVGPPACNFPNNQGGAIIGVLQTPPITLQEPGYYELSFRYLLEIDVNGQDEVSVNIKPATGSGGTGYELVQTFDLSNDGALHDLTLPFDPPGNLMGDQFIVEFLMGADTVGNTGRGWSVDDVVVRVTELGARYCFGDGSGLPCPCGNDAPGESGCANSGGAGAALVGLGPSSVDEDACELHAEGLVAGQPVLLFQGTSVVNGGDGVPFGDGLRCAGGAVVRLGLEVADAGGRASWGPGLAATGGWTPGATRAFQAWYRDPAGSPCGSGFNLSNGVEATFTP